MANEQTNQAQELDTLRNILFGEEAKSIRSLIKNVESSFTQQFRLVKQDIQKAVDDLKKELSAEIKTAGQRVSDEEKARLTSMTDVQTRLKEAVATVEAKLSRAETASKEMIATVREGLERSVASRFVEAETRAHEIEERVGQQARDLASRKTEMAKLSSLFGNFARSFTDVKEEEPAVQPAPASRPRPAPAAAAPAPAAWEAPKQTAQPRQQPAQESGDLPQADDLLSGMDSLFNLGAAPQKPKR